MPGGGYTGYRFIKHEQSQQASIDSLSQRVTVLEEEYRASNANVQWGDGFNYLAIGNSITWHPLASYWWAEDGMAASTPEKDYFHLVTDELKRTHGDVTTYAFNGAAWEAQSNDRYEVLSMGVWDSYLSEDIDLVTIQLSENATDLTTFESDFKEMVQFVVEKCPQAQIIVIDDFWSDEKSELKKAAVDELNADGMDIDWVDLSEIRGDEEYMASMGTTVYGDDGEAHIIKHDGVAKHPGDTGMAYYAEEIIKYIK